MPDDRLTKAARPLRILSKSSLLSAWKTSRDSSPKSGAAGVDGQSAKAFASNLDHHLSVLALQLKRGDFGFGPLRPKLIHKADGVRLRLICVPNVRDRLVQRTIAENIYNRDKFGKRSERSYGFARGVGLRQAIFSTLNLRSDYDYVFETDIESFFDRVNRVDLKQKVRVALGRSSLLPLFDSVIDSEVQTRNREQEKQIASLGVKHGVGLRQGMPLSPLLANLALSKFDRTLDRKLVPFIRYADDVVTFARSRQEALDQAGLVKDLLSELGLLIPDLTENGKTKIASRHQSFIFLGREFYFSERSGDYKQRVPKKKIEAILSEICEFGDIEKPMKEGILLADVIERLGRISASYKFTYSDAANSSYLDSQISNAVANTKSMIFEGLFGKGPVARLSQEQRRFLQFESVGLENFEVDDFDEY